MAELIEVNPLDYNIELFDMDPKTVKPQKFTDEDGKDSSYFTGVLTYDGKPPFFVSEGDSYGIQKENENNNKGGKPVAMPQMVQLPSANEQAKKKRAKWQVSVKLSVKPAEVDWTDDEKKRIDFINNQLRKILAHVLCKRPEILAIIRSNAINDAKERLMKDLAQPELQQKYAAQDAQLARMKEHLFDILYGKISRKVYRKKKDTKGANDNNQMDLLNAATDQYDQTKWPTLYSGIQSFVSKQTGKEEFITTYYKKDPALSVEDWPKLSHEEAVALGWYRVRVASRFDAVYFGASISSQIKAGEIIMVNPISGGLGHKGRLIKSDPDAPRDQRLITRSTIQPAGGSSGIVVPVPNPQETQTPVQTLQQPIGSVPMQFDPASLQGIPGMEQVPAPVIQNSPSNPTGTN